MASVGRLSRARRPRQGTRRVATSATEEQDRLAEQGGAEGRDLADPARALDELYQPGGRVPALLGLRPARVAHARRVFEAGATPPKLHADRGPTVEQRRARRIP